MIQLTTREEVIDRLGRPLTDSEDAVFDAAVRDVTALLYSAAPRIPTTLPLPDAVIGVATRLVMENVAASTGASTTGISSESLGGYSISYSNPDNGSGSAGMTITSTMWQALRPWTKPRIGTLQVDPDKAIVI